MNTKEIWINTALEAQAQFMAKLEKDGLDISYFKEMYEKYKDDPFCTKCAKSFTICGTKVCQDFREHEDGHIYLICSDNAKAQGYKRIHNAANAFRVLAHKLNKYVKGITENGEGVSSIFFTTNYSLLKHFEEMNKTIMTNIGKYPEYFIKSEGIRMYLITNTTFREHAEDDMLKEHESLINMWLNRRDEAVKSQPQTNKNVEIEVKVSVNTGKKKEKKDRVEPVPTPTSSIIIDERSFKEEEPKRIVINSFDQLCPWAVCEVFDAPNPYEKGIYLYPKDIDNVSEHKKLGLDKYESKRGPYSNKKKELKKWKRMWNVKFQSIKDFVKITFDQENLKVYIELNWDHSDSCEVRKIHDEISKKLEDNHIYTQWCCWPDQVGNPGSKWHRAWGIQLGFNANESIKDEDRYLISVPDYVKSKNIDLKNIEVESIEFDISILK